MRHGREIRVAALFLLVLPALLLSACEEEEKRRIEWGNASKNGEEAAPPVERVEAPDKEESTPAGRVKLHSPKPGRRGTPAAFTWNPYPGAESYRLLVLDAEEKVVYEGPRTRENLVSLADGWNDGLPGGVYFWQVLAYDGEGSEIGRASCRERV